MGDDGGYYAKNSKTGAKAKSQGSEPKTVSVPVSNAGVDPVFRPPSLRQELGRIEPKKMDARDPNIISAQRPKKSHADVEHADALYDMMHVDTTAAEGVGRSHGQTTSQALGQSQNLNQPVHLGDILIRKGFITASQLDLAIDRQKQTGCFLGETLVELGFVSLEKIVQALSDQLEGMGGASHTDPIADVEESVPEISPEAVDMVPVALATRANIMPISANHLQKILKVAVAEIRDIQTVDEVRFKTGYELEFVKVSPEFLEESWRKYYHWTSDRSSIRQNENLMNEFRAFTAKLSQDNVSAFINRVLSRAAELRVSDIHIDPFEDQVTIRFRMDGRLYQAATFSKSSFSTFMGRLKVMANIEITDKKTTLDSRILLKLNERRQVQFRISIVNSLYGERVVLRIQREAGDLPLLSELGLPKVYQSLVQKKLKSPHGLIIVTGPTGSGKTTTLYALIRELCDLSRNVITIEDPVELALPGAAQIAVDNEKGHTFARILRGVLRQDPDVIMVGEIRDEETAQIATRAAMTGHLVFCSLHTNDAPSAIARLGEMGVPSYYLAPALHLIVGQRLVRMLCEHCKKVSRPSKQVLFEMGFTPLQVKRDHFYEPVGCAHCNFTGYRGRVPIFEVLDVRQNVREAITQGKGSAAIRRAASKFKYLPFLTLLREYMRRGKTSIDEGLPYLLDD